MLLTLVMTEAAYVPCALGQTPDIPPVHATDESSCSVVAADWFKKNWPDGKDSTAHSRSTASYQSHWNAKRTKCFMLVRVETQDYNWRGSEHSVTEQVVDSEMKGAYATFAQTNGRSPGCHIEGHVCKTQAQWETLVRALYLEDKDAIDAVPAQR